MLRRDAGQSISFCDGFRKCYFFHLGRGFLPLLAVMLLATPPLAFAQGSLAVTVFPRTLEIDEVEGGIATDEYTVVLDTEPSEDVTIMVMGAPTADADITVSSDTLTFMAPSEPGGDDGTWDDKQTVTVTVRDDANAVSETVTLTHTATIGDDEDSMALSRSSVRVTAKDNDTRFVTIEVTDDTLSVVEAASATYTVVLDTEPTDMVTVDVGGASGELAVSPSRLFFMPGDYDTPQTVTVYAGEDLDAENDTATLTHTVRGGDYTGVAAATVSVVVDDNDTRGVTVAPTTLNIAAGSRGTFSIMLNSQPTGSVRIKVTEEEDDFSVSPSSLSFSSSTWNRPQTVTVRVESDFDTAQTTRVDLVNVIDTSSSSRDKAYDTTEDNPTDGNTADAVVADVDVTVSDSAAAVRLSRSSMTINEGSDAEYTVRLAANPGEGGSEDRDSERPCGFGLSSEWGGDGKPDLCRARRSGRWCHLEHGADGDGDRARG